MFLVLPQSMVIPEALERLEDANFEDWLTAAVIDAANQPGVEAPASNQVHPQATGITDLWMLEIAERRDKVWTGKFQVQITGSEEERPEPGNLMEAPAEELSFAFNTATAEITFHLIPELGR
jgi:hypothetical protein